MPVSCLRQGEAHGGWIRNDSRTCFLKFDSKRRVLNDGERTPESRDVESFAGRHQGYRVLGNFIGDGGKGNVGAIFIEQEIAMNLVGASSDFVTQAKFPEFLKFRFGKDRADGIVRVAKEKGSGLLRYRLFHGLEVQTVSPLGFLHWDLYDLLPKVSRGGEEGRVYRNAA